MTHVEILNTTVDGRNPAPVDMVKYHLIYRVLYIPSGDHRISEPSTVGIGTGTNTPYKDALFRHFLRGWHQSPL